MKWNATIIMTLFFFYPHELTKIVLQKFYKILLHQNALFGLANWTKKVFPVFPRNKPYRARPKTPPFHFFRHCETFFRKKNFPQRIPPAFFWCFATEWMLKNPKGSPLSDFFGIVRFFPENENFCFLRFFHVLRQNGCWKTSKGPPFSFSALWDVSAPGARGSEPRRATRSIFLVCNFFKKKSKIFRFSITVNEYLTLGSLFAIFEPWIWRRLGPVPACYQIILAWIMKQTIRKLSKSFQNAFWKVHWPFICDIKVLLAHQKIRLTPISFYGEKH